MKRNLTHAIAALSLSGLLAACGPGFDRTAGETGFDSFGSASMNNMLAHTEGAASIQRSLNDRFRAAAPDRINFAFNSSALDADAMAALDRQAAFIRANPSIRFRVFGHTDKVGSNSYNQRLGLRRARAAVNYLVGQGVNRRQVEAVSSLGETRPLVNTAGPERLNRRTVTEVRGFFANGTAHDFDGKRAAVIYNAYLGAGEGG
ncbi:MAG: OmpA family protein [Pseudomonadota bacterium]